MSTLHDHLFRPLSLGRLQLPNRMLFAPCTRHRAGADEVPTPIMQTYYRQRAGAGLIISEGINPSPMGRGYHFVPALYDDAQQAAWTPILQGVHDAGGAMFAQLMHNGRLSHHELLPAGAQPIAPSAVRPDPEFRGYMIRCPRVKEPYPEPRALELNEIAGVIDEFAAATRRAFAAGFDGVEIHAGSGYLPMQFLSSNTNQRSDAYGGSIENRARFLLELVEAMSAVDGADRIAVKLSPGFRFHDVHDDDPAALYAHVAQRLSGFGLAYVQASDYGDYYGYEGFDPIGLVRQHYRGLLVGNGGLNRDSGSRMIAEGRADAVAYGTAFIANPDLVERFRVDAALNVPDPETFYSQGAEGYIDYPTLDQAQSKPVTDDYQGSSTDDLARYQGDVS